MQRMQRQRSERVLSRFAGEMSRENDGKDFNTNRSVFGVLFSLENVRSVHSKVDDGKRKSFKY